MHTPLHPHPVIELKDVTKSYLQDAQSEATLVLRDINLAVRDNEFLILFGPSGSGKSSLLNIMAGLDKPTSGTVKLKGHDMMRYTSRQLAKYHRLRMGMVYQGFNLIKSLNVWENVALPQVADGVGYRLRRKRALALLETFHLADFANRTPTELSGGQQQRVAIARALINDPLFIIADEPTGNLDTTAAEEVMEILLGLHRDHKHTVVLVTHNPDYLSYSTRAVYVKDGRILKEETGGGSV